MSSKTQVEHKGIVDHCRDNTVFVKILAESACVSCKLHSICGVDTKEKIIEINNTTDIYKKGEPVVVSISEKHGYKALFIGYLLPFIVSLTTLILCVKLTGNEGLSGLLALVILAPYFLMLRFLRHRLKKSFRFNINKINE
ncbi:MAG: SoxR reducing system RseC family protein [Bacteroidota bacterium]|nr:SoxR reducing system RseC family protein [Bacteroidota bacterium]